MHRPKTQNHFGSFGSFGYKKRAHPDAGQARYAMILAHWLFDRYFYRSPTMWANKCVFFSAEEIRHVTPNYVCNLLKVLQCDARIINGATQMRLRHTHFASYPRNRLAVFVSYAFNLLC